jgi:hypothetical protein
MRHHTIILGAAASVALWSSCPRALPAQSVIASSGFNDQSGLNSNPTPNSPFTLGQTVHDRGAGESGWAGPWQVQEGGGHGGEHLVKVESFAAREGDGGLSMTPSPIAGTSRALRQLAVLQTRAFVIEQDVNFVAAGDLQSRPFYTGSTEPAGFGPLWRITGPANNRRFQVVDGVGDGSHTGEWEETGIAQRPGEWQHVVLHVNPATQLWSFSVDGVAYNGPDVLNFLGQPPGIDLIEYLTNSSGYVDGVIVRGPTPPDPWRIADANGDGRVDVADLGVVATNFNDSPPVPAGRAGGDFNGDGTVDVSDLGILSTHFNQPNAAAAGELSQQSLAAYPQLSSAVPEPSALCLFAVTGLAAVPRRRRRHWGR